MRRSVIAAAAVLVSAIYVLRLDQVAGLVVDDAWYILLAHGLARGAGYSLINAPTPGLLPPNPPGFAALLAPIFLVASFPANLWMLKAVSILAMLGAGLVFGWYLVRVRDVPGPIALAVTVATVLTPAFVFLATSTVMSECVFTFAQLSTVLLVERSVRVERPAGAVAAAMSGAATMLVRTAGAPLLVASMLYLVYLRRWRHAAVFAATAALCLLPWLWYARTHAPTMAERAAHGGAHAYSYGDEFWMRWAGDRSSGTISVGELPARVLTNLVDVFGRDVGAIVMPALYRGAAESGLETLAVGGSSGVTSAGSMGSATGTMILSLALGGFAVCGFVAAVRRRPTLAEFLVPLALAMIVLWPQWTYRFVLPLTPFLFLYLLFGLQAVVRGWRRVARIALACLITLNLADHVQYVALAYARPDEVEWLADAREVDTLIDVLRTTATKPGPIATSNPALIYLRTGRSTIASDSAALNWERWKTDGVSYVVCLQPAELPDPSLGYTVVYRSSRRSLWIIAP